MKSVLIVDLLIDLLLFYLGRDSSCHVFSPLSKPPTNCVNQSPEIVLLDPLSVVACAHFYSADDTSIRARGASISEALTNSPKTHKASIISRMARMGQATLPLKGAIVCEPSDSEEVEAS